MMSIRGLLAALVLFSVAAPAQAADWYGEFHVGTTRADNENPGITGDERTEGAYGIGVGVEYGRYFSTQLDWHTLGENADIVEPPCPIPPCPLTLTFVPLPEHSWALRALPRLPIGEDFAIELGLGLMRWEGDYNYTSSSTVRLSADGTDPYYSLGAAWRFADRWSLTVETQLLELEFIDFSWTGATLRYRF